MRSYALTIAGFDPSGGAGLAADIKTFEQHRVYGLSVCTAITLQTEDEFLDIRWEKNDDVLAAIRLMLKKYPVAAVKTGILPSVESLAEILEVIKFSGKNIPVVVDPVFRSSTGFGFIEGFDKARFYKTLAGCALVTPNTNEARIITGIDDENEAAKEIAGHCRVLLKGGHSTTRPGTDLLYAGGKITSFGPSNKTGKPKHGSGCILSAAIAARIALGHSIEEACRLSKKYVEQMLASNETLLSYHVS